MHASAVSTGNIAALWMRTGKLIRNRVFCEGKIGSVNPQQMHALFVISEHDGLTMKELAHHLDITSPSATSLVNRLVRLAWVARTADPKNRKLVRIRIAPAGRAFLRAKTKEVEAAIGGILALLNKQDQKEFARILHHLHETLARGAGR